MIAAQSLLEINPHIQVDTHTNKGGLFDSDHVIHSAIQWSRLQRRIFIMMHFFDNKMFQLMHWIT